MWLVAIVLIYIALDSHFVWVSLDKQVIKQGRQGRRALLCLPASLWQHYYL